MSLGQSSGMSRHARRESPRTRTRTQQHNVHRVTHRARDDINIYLVGSAGVGKTTLIRKFVYPEKEHATMCSTISLDLETVKDYLVPLHATDTHPSAIYNVTLRVWDTGGDENFRSTMRIGLTRANIVIYTFNASEKLPYRSCMDLGHVWHKMVESAGLLDRPAVREAESPRAHESVRPYFAMVGTKRDILNADVGARHYRGISEDVVREVHETVVSNPADVDAIGVPLYVSGLSGEGVQAAFLRIVQAYLQRERSLGRLYYVGDGSDSFDSFDDVLLTGGETHKESRRGKSHRGKSHRGESRRGESRRGGEPGTAPPSWKGTIRVIPFFPEGSAGARHTGSTTGCCG